MPKINLITKVFFLSFCTLFVSSTFAEPQNLALLTKEVIKYHDSGAYEEELDQQIKNAREYILFSVKANKNSPNPQKLAIVLDIDETSISNYNSMYKRNFLATKEQLLKEVQEANAPVIAPTLALYQEAKKHNVAIFFVSGRKEFERDATKINLQRAGFHSYTGLYLKPENYDSPSAVPFKVQARAAITKKGYKIIASIGDQCSDVIGGFTEKGFKLPNPYYYLP